MGNYTLIIFIYLVFLVSLFFFKTVLAALTASFIFLGLVALLGIIWRSPRSRFFSSLLCSITNLLIPAVLALSFYVLIYLPIEYFITETWKLAPKMPPVYALFFLLFPLVIFTSVNWHRVLKKRMARFLLFILVVVSGFAYQKYRQEKFEREYLPKIYKIDPQWGIQATLIKIEGVNFSPAWKKGKVMLDNEELVTKEWSEKLIIAEQSVPTGFDWTELYVERDDGVVSNKISFEVRDPDSLTTF